MEDGQVGTGTGWIGRGHGGCSPPARAAAKDALRDGCYGEDYGLGRERESAPRIEKGLGGWGTHEARKGEVSNAPS